MDLIRESNLRNEVERQRNLFNTVVDQLKQAQFASDFTSINSEVIEPVNALRRPVAPRCSLVLAVALLAGSAAGVAAALAADRLDQRVRSFAELRRVLDYAVLGQIRRSATTRRRPSASSAWWCTRWAARPGPRRTAPSGPTSSSSAATAGSR